MGSLRSEPLFIRWAAAESVAAIADVSAAYAMAGTVMVAAAIAARILLPVGRGAGS